MAFLHFALGAYCILSLVHTTYWVLNLRFFSILAVLEYISRQRNKQSASMGHVLAARTGAELTRLVVATSRIPCERVRASLITYVQSRRDAKMSRPPGGVKVQVWSFHRRVSLCLLTVVPHHCGLVGFDRRISLTPSQTIVRRKVV